MEDGNLFLTCAGETYPGSGLEEKWNSMQIEKLLHRSV